MQHFNALHAHMSICLNLIWCVMYINKAQYIRSYAEAFVCADFSSYHISYFMPRALAPIVFSMHFLALRMWVSVCVCFNALSRCYSFFDSKVFFFYVDCIQLNAESKQISKKKRSCEQKVKRLNENRNKRDVKKYSTHKWPMPFIRYTEIKRVLKQQQNEKQQQQHNIHSTTSMLLHLLYIYPVCVI